MKFTKEQLEAVLISASKDTTRYDRNCVRVESGALVATDGHKLIKVLTGGDQDDSNAVLLSIADVKKVIKGMAKGAVATVEQTQSGLTVKSNCGFSIEIKPHNAEYPKYQQIMKRNNPVTLEIGFNAHYVMKLCKAAIKADVRKGRARPTNITMEFTDATSPVRIKQGVDFESLLMPIRL